MGAAITLLPHTPAWRKQKHFFFFFQQTQFIELANNIVLTMTVTNPGDAIKI